MDIKLDLINNSIDANNSQIVIFQKNVYGDVELPAVAWLAFPAGGKGSHHAFVYPSEVTVGASDSAGHVMKPQRAKAGQRFHVELRHAAHVLLPAGPAAVDSQIDVLNQLHIGTIDAGIYRGGKLLALITSIPPGVKGTFKFQPTIWIGLVNCVQEGELMSPASVASANTELSLLGVACADIVMSGGGSGPGAVPVTFTLQNVVKC